MALLGDGDAEKFGFDEPELPTEIKVGKELLELGQRFCDLIYEKQGKHFEWYQFLLARRSNEGVVATDAIFPNSARVQPYFLEVEGEAHAQAADTVAALNKKHNLDLFTCGWLHSHGAGMPGFSKEDDKNAIKLLNTIRLNTQQRGFSPWNLIEGEQRMEWDGDALSVLSDDAEDGVIRVEPTDALRKVMDEYGIDDGDAFLREAMMALRLRTGEPKIVGFSYNVVINAKGDTPHGELYVSEEKPITAPKKVEGWCKKVVVTPVDVPMVLQYSDDLLEEIVDKHMTFVKPPKIKKATPTMWQGTTIVGGATHVGQSAKTGKHYGIQPTQYTKTAEPSLDDWVDPFVNAAASYVSACMLEQVQYSQYLEEVMKTISDSGYGTGSMGLADGIRHVGALYTDGETVSSDVTKWRWGASSKIGQNLTCDPYSPEMLLMRDFILGDKNKALELYVPEILAESDDDLMELIQPD